MADVKLERLYHDPTPNRVVAHRLGLEIRRQLESTNLSEKERNEFQEVIRKFCLKLIAAWKAVKNYQEVTTHLIEESRKCPGTGDDFVRRVEPSQDLYECLDTFLTQFKSSLDYLVKAGCPIFGRRRWSLRTFKDKGKKVQNVLEKLPSNFQHVGFELSRLISANQVWLDEVIDFRDWMNHGLDGGPDPSILTIHSEKVGDKVNVYIPLFRDVPLEDYLLQMWWNLFAFSEGFLAHLLWARAKEGIRLYYRPVPHDSQYSPWALFPEGLLEKIGHPSVPVGSDRK